MIYFTKEQIKSIIENCKINYPKEACGILAGKIFTESEEFLVEEVYNMQNVSNEPEICYFMDPKEQLKVLKEIRNKNLEMVGIFHSHTHTEAYPSKRDCELAYYPEVAYVIVSLENFNTPKIRAFRILNGEIKEIEVVVRKNILFVYVENSCRSQIAEGLTNHLYWRRFKAYSAGSKPSGVVNPIAIEVMKEIGIDISQYKSKGFNELIGVEFDYVVTMGCGDVCPFYPAKEKIDWDIEDPKDKPKEVFVRIREQIKSKIENMIQTNVVRGFNLAKK